MTFVMEEIAGHPDCRRLAAESADHPTRSVVRT
jgi:hypothetical protein